MPDRWAEAPVKHVFVRIGAGAGAAVAARRIPPDPAL